MRTLLKVTIDAEPGNRGILEGALPKVIQSAIDKLKPEAAYFYSNNGKRCCMMVFDMKDSSEMPGITEPFFMALNAEVELCPVMNAEDLQKGLGMFMSSQNK